MKTVLMFVFLLSMFSSASFCQSRIQTRSGGVYEGLIVSDTGNFVLIKTFDGADVKIAKAEISIEEHNLDLSGFGKKSFPLAGISLGTPAGIQFLGGYYFGDIGTRVSLGYWGELHGVQLNLFRNLSRSKSFSHNIGIAGGYIHFPGSEILLTDGQRFYTARLADEWTYIAALYDINWGGFFGELGFSIGSGSFHNPQLMIQLGYVYEFRF